MATIKKCITLEEETLNAIYNQMRKEQSGNLSRKIDELCRKALPEVND